MNNFNLSEDKQNALIQMAAQKLGKDPAELKKQLESGQIDNITKGMDSKTTGQLNALLNNPKAVEALLGNENIRNILSGLGKGSK